MITEFINRVYDSMRMLKRKQITRKLILDDVATLKRQKAGKRRDAAIEKLTKQLPAPVRVPAIVVINQMRAKMGGFGGKDSPGGNALKHGKSVDIRLQHEEFIEGAGTDKVPLPYDDYLIARRVGLQVDKNKVGPPRRRASFVLGQANFGPYKLGRIDRADEVLQLAVRTGAVEVAGSWFTIAGTKFQGAGAVTAAIRESDDLRLALERDVLTRTAV